MSAIRVLIVSPYASVRAGLHALLAEAEDIGVVGQVGGSAELERLLPEVRPDVVLADGGPEDQPSLLSLLADGEIGLTLLGEARGGWQALAEASLPGWAYLLREADGTEIAGAIRAVAAGLIVLDRSLAPMLSAQPLRLGRAGGEPNEAANEALTVREREVLELIARGLPNKQIAVRLAISPHTAKFHVASILAKLGAASRTEAVTRGARRGDVSF